jgi:uncharacterized protein (DUF2126 family)
MTERWSTRSGKLFLIPGDSPVGYRLRLGALPHVEPLAYPHVILPRPVRRWSGRAAGARNQPRQATLRATAAPAEAPGEHMQIVQP